MCGLRFLVEIYYWKDDWQKINSWKQEKIDAPEELGLWKDGYICSVEIFHSWKLTRTPAEGIPGSLPPG